MNNFVDIKTDSSHVDWDASWFNRDALNQVGHLNEHPNPKHKKCLKVWAEKEASYPECRLLFDSTFLFNWTDRKIKMLTNFAKETIKTAIENDARIRLINGSAGIVVAAAHAGDLKTTEAALEIIAGTVITTSLAIFALTYAHRYRHFLPTLI